MDGTPFGGREDSDDTTMEVVLPEETTDVSIKIKLPQVTTQQGVGQDIKVGYYIYERCMREYPLTTPKTTQEVQNSKEKTPTGKNKTVKITHVKGTIEHIDDVQTIISISNNPQGLITATADITVVVEGEELKYFYVGSMGPWTAPIIRVDMTRWATAPLKPPILRES